MKWIGQNIYDFISKFRNDVYLEDIDTGTIASGGNLGLDSNNKVVKDSGVGATDLHGAGVDGSANQLLTDDGDGTVTSESYLTFANSSNLSRMEFLSNEDTGDKFQITATTHGATTLATFDDDATAAHFEIAADGDITLDAAGDIKLEATGEITLEAGENDVTIDTDTIKVTSASSAYPYLELENTNSNTRSGKMTFHKNHGAGVDNETLGSITFKGYNDAGTPTAFNYATIEGKVADMTSGQEAGRLELGVVAYQGVSEIGLVIDGDTNSDGEVDVDIALGTGSVTTIAGTLTMGSIAFANNTGQIQVASQGTIDHDSLANFEATEHIDWTGSSAGTIHSTNIPTLNQNTTGEAGTVATIAGLAPNTATTQATQGNITSCANLATVGTIGTGVWNGTKITDVYTNSSGKRYGNTIKILPGDWMVNDDAASPLSFKDGGNSGVMVNDTSSEMIAFVTIPEGMKATALDIYSTNNKTVSIYELDLDSSFDFSGSGPGANETGNANTQITIDPPISATDKNVLAIVYTATATANRIWGGLLTIAPQ